MVDCILGVSDPKQWHTENLKMNSDHYASWMIHLGGAKLITEVADEIGVGVHFNPFVFWKGKMFKYGVVRMDDLVRDVLNWEKLYLSGRLQKPIRILVDNLDMENINSVNLRAATAAALLLSPNEVSEGNLYAKICSLSYLGDVRMLFAEDKNKVKKIVHGQFDLFRKMYKPVLEEYATKDLLKITSCTTDHVKLFQDCGLSAASSLVSRLPPAVRSEMALKLGEKKTATDSGKIRAEVVVRSREEAAECMRKILRRKVMVSSARQAVSGLLTAGTVNGVRYLSKKMSKAWKSWS